MTIQVRTIIKGIRILYQAIAGPGLAWFSLKTADGIHQLLLLSC